MKLSFNVSQTGFANVTIYDMSGRLITTLFNGEAEKDVMHQISFDAGKLSAGIYICRLQTVTGVMQQRIVLRK